MFKIFSFYFIQIHFCSIFILNYINSSIYTLFVKCKIQKNKTAKVIRDGKEIFAGVIDQLKRFKDDVKEVANGYECGIMFDRFNDIKVGDFIETFIQIEEKVSVDK